MRKGALIQTFVCVRFLQNKCLVLPKWKSEKLIRLSAIRDKKETILRFFPFCLDQLDTRSDKRKEVRIMAIYHFSAQVFSRSKGQSAVAAAAYRSGERLEDERTGEKKFYKRDVQPETMILAPSPSPEWVYDRNRLWNEVEKSETRKNSQLAREINIALPKELTKDQQTELIKHYVQTQFIDKGMIADIAVHRDDPENPHAHVMLTTREISEEGFGKKNRDWNDRELLNQWREQWADHANKALEREGIQDRISHLSNQARGLEQLPTVHLGHVAHEMEQKGFETDRGNINRERQEYNALVVDLQTYREEKQALEQEKARRQEQTKEDKKYLGMERVHLQEASKILKAEPTLENIEKRLEQLDKWEKRVDNNSQYLRWKDEKIKEASEHYRWIHHFENNIRQEQQRIESINWMNPLKIKDNRMMKERAEQEMAKAKREIKFHHERLHYHREKLGFHSLQEFNQVKNQHEADLPGLLEKNRNDRKQIHSFRDTLQKAENAHKSAFVRQVASLYPDRPEMRHMSLETAKKLNEINQWNGNKVVPVENIEKILYNRKETIQELQGEIARINRHQSRMQRAEDYLRNYEKYQSIVEKIENNPFSKGKTLISKSARQEYDHAVSERDRYQDLMKQTGVSGRDDFEKQMNIVDKWEKERPTFEKQIQSNQSGLGLLEGILNGLEQANRAMLEHERRQQLQKQKGKKHSGLER